jgi:hypothetical protein
MRKLLEAHERSGSFGKPAPWPRDVILSVDAKAFPEAFAPDGRERLDALRHAILNLEEAKLCRVTYERGGGGDALPKQLRLGPDELSAAYLAAIADGFVPLANAIDVVRNRVEEQQRSATTDWAANFLEKVRLGLAAADPSPFGMSRERFKRLHIDVADALTALCAISTGVDAWERMLSERIFGRTKRLGAIRSLVGGLLVRADPAWLGLDSEDMPDVLESYGVRRKPGLLRCAGAGRLRINTREYRLEDFVPVAALPEAWGSSWRQAAAEEEIETITTIENEYSFLSYVDEVGGVEGLRRRREYVVYVAGFPAPWLTSLLQQTVETTGATLRHWGDADVGGLLIWRLLRMRVGRPVPFFRTTPDWIRSETTEGGQPLSMRERAALHRLRESFELHNEDDYREAHAIASALLAANRKLEQERY